MTRYFAGNRVASFRRLSDIPTDVTTAGRFDSAFVSSAISHASSRIETPRFVATGLISVGVTGYYGWTGGFTGLITLWNGNTEVYRINPSNANPVLQYWNGTAWIGGATATFPPGSILTRYTLNVNMNSSMELYIGDVLFSSLSGITGAATTVTHASFEANVGCFTSEVMVADYDLRGARYSQRPFNANGVYTDGTGGFADVNGSTDASAISLPVVGNKKSFAKAAITVPSGYEIKTAVVSARARVGGAVADGSLGVYSSATYSKGPDEGYSSAYYPNQQFFDLDPNGSVPWTQSSFNSAQAVIEAE